MEAGLLQRSHRVLPKLPGQATGILGGVGVAVGALGRGPTVCPCAAHRQICVAVGTWGSHRPQPGTPAVAGDLFADAAGGRACVQGAGAQGLF